MAHEKVSHLHIPMMRLMIAMMMAHMISDVIIANQQPNARSVFSSISSPYGKTHKCLEWPRSMAGHGDIALGLT